MKNAPKKVPRGWHKIFQDENDRFLTICVWNDTKAVRFVSTCSDPTVVSYYAFILFTSTNKIPRRNNYTQSEFRIALWKQLIGSFSVCKYEPKVQPLFISPDASND